MAGVGSLVVFEIDVFEIQHRIRCAWSALARHRQELTSNSHLLRHRLRLFDSVVTPTLMFRAGTCATRKEH